MLILYQGRQFEKKIDLQGLIGHFLSELPWIKSATESPKKTK